MAATALRPLAVRFTWILLSLFRREVEEFQSQ